MEAQAYTSKTLDHLGLAVGMCRQIGIGELIDSQCPSDSPDQIVSTGKAPEAMTLNGLGFINKRLYLIPHFFRDKPADLLLGAGFEADHFSILFCAETGTRSRPRICDDLLFMGL